MGEKKEKSLTIKLDEKDYLKIRDLAKDSQLSTRTYAEAMVNSVLRASEDEKTTPNILKFYQYFREIFRKMKKS